MLNEEKSSSRIALQYSLLSIVIGFDMEVQPLVTHNAACPLCVSAISVDVVSNHLLFAHMT